MKRFRLAVSRRKPASYRFTQRKQRVFRLYIEDAGHKAFVPWEALELSLGVRKYQITRPYSRAVCGVYDVTQQVVACSSSPSMAST